MKTFLRTYGVTAGLFVMLLVTFCATLMIAPAEADAGCATTTVTTSSRGRSASSSVTRCSAPRVRRCHFTTRCTPQRTCVSRSSGRMSSSSCSTRDVCKRVEVCT
jgi:hypothetical protein